jgi:hypothetical protein
MEIKLKPTDIIERFLWDKYEYFCLEEKSNLEIANIIKLNEEFIISENDAFVIGLINVIYTPEVIYKFKQFLLGLLSNKSFEFEDTADNRKKLFINPQLFVQSINTFKNKIPKNWTSTDIEFNNLCLQLPEKYTQFIENLEKLDILLIQDFPCVKCAQVKKIINRL